MRKFKLIALLSLILTTITTITITQNSYPALAVSYTCDDIIFGEEKVATGSSKDYSIKNYQLTNFINAKHTDNKSTIIGTTTKDKYEGEFTLTSQNTVSRVIVYAVGHTDDAESNFYLSVNGQSQKVTKVNETFQAYTYNNINAKTLTFRNNELGKKGRIYISKIVLRIAL